MSDSQNVQMSLWTATQPQMGLATSDNGDRDPSTWTVNESMERVKVKAKLSNWGPRLTADTHSRKQSKSQVVQLGSKAIQCSLKSQQLVLFSPIETGSKTNVRVQESKEEVSTVSGGAWGWIKELLCLSFQLTFWCQICVQKSNFGMACADQNLCTRFKHKSDSDFASMFGFLFQFAVDTSRNSVAFYMAEL